MQYPLITIGITAYNAEATIEKAVASAILQTWKSTEIIIVDDNSTDNTQDILVKLSKHYPQLVVVRNEINGGVAVSRNRIIDTAKGEFIVFFDDDDTSQPERVEKQYLRIINYERDYADGSPVICHTARRVIYHQNNEHIEETMGQNTEGYAPSGIAVAERILIGTPLVNGYGACPTCSQMARKSTYINLSGFDENLRRGEDTDFNIRLALTGGHFVGISTPLVNQVMTKTSEKNLSEEKRNMLVLIDKHKLFLENKGQYHFCKRWINMKMDWLEKKYFDFIISLIYLFIRQPILTIRRLILATPNIKLNSDFGSFHINKNKNL